ncbi:MAG TPA: antibiotic biosynthesis monooxygenase [Rhizomicrobium sp.]|jgi:quinol monooxygenase YgiN
MRIVVAGAVDVAPEKREQALKGARPLIEQALAEHGCVEYSWTADLSIPGRIRVFEEWESEADLAVHLAGQPYRSMLAHLQGVGIVNAVTQKYRVDHFEPVYDPEGRPRADFFTKA